VARSGPYIFIGCQARHGRGASAARLDAIEAQAAVQIRERLLYLIELARWQPHMWGTIADHAAVVRTGEGEERLHSLGDNLRVLAACLIWVADARDQLLQHDEQRLTKMLSDYYESWSVVDDEGCERWIKATAPTAPTDSSTSMNEVVK
jgi:hypothetical protein